LHEERKKRKGMVLSCRVHIGVGKRRRRRRRRRIRKDRNGTGEGGSMTLQSMIGGRE